jgi:type II secretion system protein N
MLIGTLHVAFGASLGDGEIEGYFQSDDTESALSVTLESVDVGAVTPLKDIVGLPLQGALSGALSFSLPEGEMSGADGELDLTVADLKVGDGKAKVRGTIALPKLEAGELELSAEAVQGRLDIRNFSTKGKDFELSSTGSLSLRDPVDQSLSDLGLRFKFTDAYKNKNDLTKGLFGDPGSNVPGLFDLDPSIKRAKTPDGFYSWRVSGQLAKLNFRPSPASGPSRSTSASRLRTSSSKTQKKKKKKKSKK